MKKFFKNRGKTGNTFIENIFSVKNTFDRKYKVVTVFFMKFKFRRKKIFHPEDKARAEKMFSRANEHSVLIFEVQAHHGECLPGWVKYFVDLGYHVDLLLLREMTEQNPLCRMPADADFNIIRCNLINREEILKNDKILNYKHVLIATATYRYNANGLSEYPVIAEFPILRHHPSLIIVEHDIRDIDVNASREFLDKNRIVTLWQFQCGTMVNPCYFGDVRITAKNGVPLFIVVGKIEKKRRNYDLLFGAIENLQKKTQNFHVVIIGNVEEEHSIPEKQKPFVTITGYLNFPEMYDYMEKADFYMPLLDPDNPEHKRYLNNGVTGSLQLILGFRKIPIIQKQFADFYGFDNNNAVVYQDSLEKAMMQAVDITTSEYLKLQNNLNAKTMAVYAQSKQNLKTMIAQDD